MENFDHEEAKKSADIARSNSEELLNKFNELTNKIRDIDVLAKKIENMENEVIKRNPTPVEKLEMRSLDSYPYSVKLSDFWSERGDNVNTKAETEKEYSLDRDEVTGDYSESSIKNSFDTEDYEEEEIF